MNGQEKEEQEQRSLFWRLRPDHISVKRQI